MMSRKFATILGAMCLLALVAAPATAEVVTSSDVKYIKTIMLDHSKVDTLAGICFDPTYTSGGNYDRLFMINRTSSTSTRGIYWEYLSTGTMSDRLAVTGGSGADPTGVVADSSGSIYVTFYATPSVEKVANPTTAPVQTQMLGNYDGSSDDDPYSIDMMPATFGLSGYGADDLLMLDHGINANNRDAVVAIKSDGSKSHQIVWSQTTTGNDQYHRGAANPVDGKYYFALQPYYTSSTVYQNMPTVVIDGVTYPAIYRVGSDGVRQTIAMKMPTGEAFSAIDKGIAANPVDGSIWLVRNESSLVTPTDTLRSMVRLDVANAVDKGSNVYLANAAVEITWNEDFNCGLNAARISPDGKYLVVGSLSTTTNGAVDDRLAIFEIPEPSALMLVSLGLFSVATIRRRWAPMINPSSV